VENNYNEQLMCEGTTYTVGMNDGCIIKNVIYAGTKQFYGKTMMCFQTKRKSEITINPSYFSYSIEGATEMNEIIYKQGKEVAWEN
tara:strand:- start:3145 stop:3402 length:258 start_codon:yes stop_codon:yes gene_type:complete